MSNKQNEWTDTRQKAYEIIVSSLDTQEIKDISLNSELIAAYFGRIRTLIPATSGQRFGIIRTA